MLFGLHRRERIAILAENGKAWLRRSKARSKRSKPGLPKAPQKRHRGHPEELQDTSLPPLTNKSNHRCSKLRKMNPQGLTNQVFFKACGARCLILSMVFWRTANMQSAHACAVQTAFQAPPTHLKISVKHTPGTQKHKYYHVSISNLFLPHLYLKSHPQKPVNLDITRTGKYLFFLARPRKRRHTRDGNSKEEQSKSKARTTKTKQEQARSCPELFQSCPELPRAAQSCRDSPGLPRAAQNRLELSRAPQRSPGAPQSSP